MKNKKQSVRLQYFNGMTHWQPLFNNLMNRFTNTNTWISIHDLLRKAGQGQRGWLSYFSYFLNRTFFSSSLMSPLQSYWCFIPSSRKTWLWYYRDLLFFRNRTRWKYKNFNFGTLFHNVKYYFIGDWVFHFTTLFWSTSDSISAQVGCSAETNFK